MAAEEPKRTWSFEIPGDPAPWQVYTKQGPPPIGVLNFQAWQEQIRAYLRPLWGDREPLPGPVVVDTVFYRPWPKTAPQKETARVRWMHKHIIMKPDVGNYRKAFLDALEGIVYVNDSQVLGGNEWKMYGHTGWTDVVIREH